MHALANLLPPLFAVEFNDPFWKKEIADGKMVCVVLLK